MSLTAADIHNVQSSFALIDDKLKAADSSLADKIYAELFSVAPQVKPMFSGDMRAQKAKLNGVFIALVKGLNDIDSLTPTVKKLGKSHHQYGVEPAHYDVLKQVIMTVFVTELGDELTPETAEAWGKVYDFVAENMQAVSA